MMKKLVFLCYDALFYLLIKKKKLANKKKLVLTKIDLCDIFFFSNKKGINLKK